MRILKGSHHNLRSPLFVGDDGETPEDCTTDPTVTVTREDGTALTPPAVTDKDDASAFGPGAYTALLTPTVHTSQCDNLVVVWTGTTDGLTQRYTQYVQVVGAHYVTIPELRNERGLEPKATIPTSLLEEVRDEFEDDVEREAGVALVRRYARDRIDGNGCHRLLLPRPQPRTLLSVTVNGTSQTVGNFDLFDEGAIGWRSQAFPFPDSTNGSRNVVVAYEHGYDAPSPGVRRKALEAIRLKVLERISDRRAPVLSESFGEGAGVRYKTYEQFVTEAARLVDESIPGIG